MGNHMSQRLPLRGDTHFPNRIAYSLSVWLWVPEKSTTNYGGFFTKLLSFSELPRSSHPRRPSIQSLKSLSMSQPPTKENWVKLHRWDMFAAMLSMLIVFHNCLSTILKTGPGFSKHYRYTQSVARRT